MLFGSAPVLLLDRALKRGFQPHFFIFLLFLYLRRIRFLAHLSLIRDDCLIINNKLKLSHSYILLSLILKVNRPLFSLGSHN
jgi:hypothetical protein